MKQELFFIWYHKFYGYVYNTPNVPFIHNLHYLSRNFNINIVYFLEKDINMIEFKKAKFFNFKTYLPEYIKYVDAVSSPSNKIDLMKMIVLSQYKKFTDADNIIVLDMDADIIAVSENKYDLEPFFNDEFPNLMSEKNPLNLKEYFKSYIQNQCTRINQTGSEWLKQNLNLNKIMEENQDEKNYYKNNYKYMLDVYVNLIIKYFKEEKNFIFPDNIMDLNFENTANIIFSEGQTWNMWSNIPTYEYYIYDRKKRPVYGYEKEELYKYICKKDKQKIQDITKSFEKRNYDLQSCAYFDKKTEKYEDFFTVLKKHFDDDNFVEHIKDNVYYKFSLYNNFVEN